MGVSARHPNYSKRIDQWVRCRDVVDGSDAVKAKGKTYLPALEGQSTSDYKAYKARALFFSAAGRSLQGFVGLVTRRLPKLMYPDVLQPYFDDTVLSSTSFIEVFKDTAFEVLLTGRYGLLIDWPEDGGEAYITSYAAEDIINWFNGGYVVKEVHVEPDPDDPFTQVEVLYYRHLYLKAGIYTVDVYNADEALIKSIVPTVRGQPLDKIPMVIINPIGLGMNSSKPPMLDIVDVNISLYMSSADLEHGRHYTALPTPVVIGAPSDTVLKIGSLTAWCIPDPKAKVQYLEFLGQGLQSIENAIKEKTAQMAQFSSRLMDLSTRGSEAAETVKLRHSSEAATLSSVAIAIESGLNKVFRMLAEFNGEPPESVLVKLYKDFLNTKLSAQELRELTTAYLDNAIDEETYLYNLERGEVSVPQQSST